MTDFQRLAESLGARVRAFQQSNYVQTLPTESHRHFGHCMALSITYLARFGCEWLAHDNPQFGGKSFEDLTNPGKPDKGFQILIQSLQNWELSRRQLWTQHSEKERKRVEAAEEAGQDVERWVYPGGGGHKWTEPMIQKARELDALFGRWAIASRSIPALVTSETEVFPERTYRPPYHDLVTQCATEPGRYLVLTDNHAMAIVTQETRNGGRYIYFDPNGGEAEFASAAGAQRAVTQFHRFVVEYLDLKSNAYKAAEKIKMIKVLIREIDTSLA